MGKLIKGDFERKDVSGHCKALLDLFRKADLKPYVTKPTNVIHVEFIPHQHQSMFPKGINDPVQGDIGSIERTIEFWRAEGFLRALPLKHIDILREYFLGPEVDDGTHKMVKKLPYRGGDSIMTDDHDAIVDILIWKKLVEHHGIDTVMWTLYEWHVDLFKEFFEEHRHMRFSK